MAKKERERFVIQHDHIILCEGADEMWFLIHFLNSSELKMIHSGFSENIDVFDFGGINDLGEKMELLKVAPNYERVKSILIFRDAESDADAAVQSIKQSLKNSGFTVPNGPCEWTDGEPKTSFLLLPTCSSDVCAGTLEDLCLSILREEKPPTILEDVDGYLQHIEAQRKEQFKKIHKNKFYTYLASIYTYLASTDEYVSLKIGEAAKANAFNWNSERLSSMKSHLLQVITM